MTLTALLRIQPVDVAANSRMLNSDGLDNIMEGKLWELQSQEVVFDVIVSPGIQELTEGVVFPATE